MTGNFNRNKDTKAIETILKAPQSSFFYVRGRRRVGKSWILKKIAKKHKNVFYYMGAQDLKTSGAFTDFILEWENFSKQKKLSEINPVLLSWKRIFDEITLYIKTSKTQTVLIFDEIQWIAKAGSGSGFIGKLKEAWIDLEKTDKAKVVICGSSYKFFQENTGGEEVILRGMKTHSDILVQPLSLSQCRKEYFTSWNLHETTIAYMMTGGVPYYLKQIDPRKAFISAINDAFFCKNTIFTAEVDEVLRLEFNRQGIKTVKVILEAIGTYGATQVTIIKKTKISDATVSEILTKLEDYAIVDGHTPSGSPTKANRSGVKYYIKDFYLNTYFSLLAPLQEKIIKNNSALIFSNEYLKDFSSYYIENYTGPMFEKVIRYILELRLLEVNLFKKLDLRDENYRVTQFWDRNQQVDIIIEHPRDRISRAIEVKWVNKKTNNLAHLYNALEEKDYPLPKNFSRRNYLALSLETQKQSDAFQILLPDLF